MKKLLGILVVAVSVAASAFGNIVITPTTNATQLATALTSSGAAGISVTAVTLQGQALSSGEVSSGTYILSGPIPDTYGMTLPGIVLSTGNVSDYGTGPNTSTGKTTSFGPPATAAQELLLDPITGAFDHYDCTELDITFNMQSGFDQVFFQVVFGSEEYAEFVNSSFIDGFGLYLNGSNIAFTAGAPININHPGMAAISGTELDGVLSPGGTNTILTFSLTVTPGSVGNQLSIILSDTSDTALDTTVYVMALGGGVPNLPAVTCSTKTLPAQHNQCITRDARFWFTHPQTNIAECVTLERAIQAMGGAVCLGFQTLPVEYENSDNVKDAGDATIEALGLYWRSVKVTGEDGGSQNQKLQGSPLCRARKQCSVQLIAAMANNALLGTAPGNCPYSGGASNVTFPSDLIEQAGAAIRGEDVNQINFYADLLTKFNGSGQTNDFPSGLVECSQTKKKELKKLSKDPTTQLTCPGINDTAGTAQSIVSFPFSSKVDLQKYADNFPSPSCGTGGADAVWKITPAVGIAGSQYTMSSSGSNFDVLLSVWKEATGSFTAIACGASTNGIAKTTVSFTADGTSTYYLVGEGVNGAVGQLKIKVTSP